MGKINNIWAYLDKQKYLITIILGLLLVCVIDENSLMKYVSYQLRINELTAEIETYQKQFERDSTRLKTLYDDPKGVERVARERYLMKRDNEEIFVMSTDREASEELQNELK
ncbi:MAG: septum formation initiator family protein [Prevotella sp.]|nr:septum formation initiator family protein [Prevotella sp.]